MGWQTEGEQGWKIKQVRAFLLIKRCFIQQYQLYVRTCGRHLEPNYYTDVYSKTISLVY